MTLSEEEFLDILEREERALLGDTTVLRQIIELDVPRLLTRIRDLQRVEQFLARIIQGVIDLSDDESGDG